MNTKAFRLILISLLCWTSFPQTTSFARTPRETPVVKVFRDWSPSVVNISTQRIVLLRQNPYWGGYGDLFDNLFRDFYQGRSAVQLKSLGSGVILTKEGMIVTNAHVIHMASEIYVILSDGTSVKAALMGVAPKNDLALIQIDPPHPLKPVKIAKDILIGETAVAIGNPFGLQNSVTTGVVSGTQRKFFIPTNNTAFSDLIQTDASINPGSSGGALFNLEGELMGINLAVVQNAQNIGFAISGAKVDEIFSRYKEMVKKDQPRQIPVK